MEATDMWRYTGCPHSSSANDNQLHYLYR